jgi:hypothetical protein
MASGSSAWTVQSDEMRTDIDVDMIHIAVCHDSPVAMVGNEPAHGLGLASGNAEVNRLPRGMAGRVVRAGYFGAGTTGRDDLDVVEVRPDAVEKRAGLPRQTRNRRIAIAYGVVLTSCIGGARQESCKYN